MQIPLRSPLPPFPMAREQLLCALFFLGVAESYITFSDIYDVNATGPFIILRGLSKSIWTPPFSVASTGLFALLISRELNIG